MKVGLEYLNVSQQISNEAIGVQQVFMLIIFLCRYVDQQWRWKEMTKSGSKAKDKLQGTSVTSNGGTDLDTFNLKYGRDIWIQVSDKHLKIWQLSEDMKWVGNYDFVISFHLHCQSTYLHRNIISMNTCYTPIASLLIC